MIRLLMLLVLPLEPLATNGVDTCIAFGTERSVPREVLCPAVVKPLTGCPLIPLFICSQYTVCLPAATHHSTATHVTRKLLMDI